jgi:hypothetical protein
MLEIILGVVVMAIALTGLRLLRVAGIGRRRPGFRWQAVGLLVMGSGFLISGFADQNGSLSGQVIRALLAAPLVAGFVVSHRLAWKARAEAFTRWPTSWPWS